MKILMLSCYTGQGHNSAAFALKEEFERRGVRCDVADPVLFKSRNAQNFVSSFYNGMIHRIPTAFVLLYKAGTVYDRSRIISPVYIANATYSEKLYHFICDNDYDAVVATHLYGMEALTAAKKRYGLSVPTYGVLTDYTTIPFTAETKLSAYFIPKEDQADYLIKRGCDPKAIFPYGIPVSKRFNTDITKRKAREKLNIPQDKSVLMVMSGGVGSVKLEDLCRKLVEATDDSCVIYALIGKSAKMRETIEKTYSENGRVKAVPFTKNVHLYMRAADVLLSKPGGLSCTEAAVCGVPLIHVDTIPGCETVNAKLFSKLGMSVFAKNHTMAAQLALELLRDREKADELVKNQRENIIPDSAAKIVDEVMSR